MDDVNLFRTQSNTVKNFEGTQSGREKAESLKRRELFDAQDAIDAQREELIKNIEKQLKQRRSVKTLFCIRWKVK